MPAEQATTDALAGQTVGGRYRLIRRIGKGGMGVVYEAEHVGLDKRVAVKFLLERFTDDPDVVERFHREARTASRIGHENIIDVTDVGTHDDGRPYIVMELLDGSDLATVIDRVGPMPAARAVHVIRQVLRGLEAAHAKGIVHRDMKPENVFLVERGGDADAVKIMDFGISKVIAANDSKVRLTATGAVIGTPVYMAPEQALAQAEVDHRVDLYAVGVMLYELLAGRPPFMATNYLGLVTQHLNTPPPSLAGARPDLPPQLVAAVHRALEKDPAARFQSCGEMARALPAATALRDLELSATLGDTAGVRVVTPEASARAAIGATHLAGTGAPPRARTATWIVGGAVLVAVGMIAVAATMRGDDRAARGSAPPAPESPAALDPVVPPPGEPERAPEVVTIGKIDVVTRPPGAKVFVGGVHKGDTPILLGGIAAGTHDVRLELAGHKTIALEVVVAGGTTRVDETMEAVSAVTTTGVQPAQPEPSAPKKVVRPGRAGSGDGGSKPTGDGGGKPTGDGGGKPTGDGGGKPAGDGGSKPAGDGGSKPTGDKGGSGSRGRPGQKPNPYD